MPRPAPTAVNWGWEDLGQEEPSGTSTSHEYSVWVYWSNNEVTTRDVDIPLVSTESSTIDGARFRDAVWGTIHNLIREGTVWRPPDAAAPTDPELPDTSGHLSMGPPEPPPPDPEEESLFADEEGADADEEGATADDEGEGIGQPR